MKLATLVTGSTSSLPSPHTVTSALLSQCRKRQNIAYRGVAIQTLGAVASTLEVDVFSEFSEIAFPILLPVRVVIVDFSLCAECDTLCLSLTLIFFMSYHVHC